MISIPKGKKPLHRRWFALAFLLRCFEHDFLKKFRDTVVVTGWQVRRSSCCAKLNFRACSLHAPGECRLRSHAFSLARMFLRRGTVPSLDAKGCNMPYPFFIRAIPVRHSLHSYPCPYTILIFHCFATLQGRNRSRMQQPHHRNLMKSKQLSKRREVAKKRHERQTETAEGEKTVTVSGALGPFSLLLQVCFINKKRKKTRKTSYV